MFDKKKWEEFRVAEPELSLELEKLCVALVKQWPRHGEADTAKKLEELTRSKEYYDLGFKTSGLPSELAPDTSCCTGLLAWVLGVANARADREF